jgi:Ca-activated chloride channel family protein
MIVAKPYFFWLLLLLVPLFIVGLRKYALGKKDFILLSGEWRAKEMGRLYAMKSLVVSVCALAVFVFSVCGLAGFQAGERVVSEERSGHAVVIALDISNSMLAEDIYPSRLTASARAVSKLVTGMKESSFALVIFKGKAINIWPLSDDRGAISDFLDTVETGFITSPGTNISAAIDAGLDACNSSGRYFAIVLFTDGEDLTGDIAGASNRAAKKNVPVIPVLVGTEKGAYIPNPSGGFVKDDFGKNVVSRANRKTLEQIANITKGKLIVLDRNKDLSKEIAGIAEARTDGSGAGFRTIKNDLYPYFIALALFFLALGYIARGIRWQKML